MLVVNASNLHKDFEWLQAQKFGDIELENVSDLTAQLSVQGPKSMATIQKLTNVNLSKIEYYAFMHGMLAGVSMIISRTAHSGHKICAGCCGVAGVQPGRHPVGGLKTPGFRPFRL